MNHSPNTWVESCLLLALLLPLFSFFLSLVIPKRMVSFTASVLLFLSATCAGLIFFSGWKNQTYFFPMEWFSIGTYKFSAGLEVNHYAIIMLPVVTVISFLVHLYSTAYMTGDAGIKKYFALLGFFTFTMLGIVLADNMLLIFVFWELVGFSSYMLIGHWTEKTETGKAATKAFIFNRIGDLGFLIGLMIIWSHAGTFTMRDLLQSASEIYSWQTAASLCIFGGVIGKSAQFPLLTWLPDAMEGPTPVSALIHAATMVAAGVFLLARVFDLFTPVSLNVVAIVGAITALMGALSALSQYDIKKILAYSTISQLGLMVTAIGAGSANAAMMHLFSHAFFKACLFLAAGSVIHALHQAQHQSSNDFDVQDIRNLGGLRKKLPITLLAFVVGGSALAGLPFFSGFLTKDAILSSLWFWSSDGFSWTKIILISTFLVSFLTVLYTFRMIWYVFAGKETVTETLHTKESSIVIRLPLVILSIASLWLVISVNPFDYSGWLYTALNTGKHFHFNLMAIISACWTLIALITAYFVFRSSKIKSSNFLFHGFYLDRLYAWLGENLVAWLAAFSDWLDRRLIDRVIHIATYVQVTLAYFIHWLDQNFIDGTVDGVARLAGEIGTITRSFQGGKIQLYIFWAILGMIIFLIWTLV